MSSPAALDEVSMLHLRYFVAVVDAGTVRAAAECLRISQPSLSQQIGRLARRMGGRLFDRSAVGMTPTDLGVRLAELARRQLLELAALTPAAGPVDRVGIPRGTTPAVLQRLVDTLGNAISFHRVDSADALAALEAGDIDAAVVHMPPARVGAAWLAKLRVTEMEPIPLGALMSAQHPLAARTVLRWSDLAGQDLVWFAESRAPAYADWLLSSCRRQGWRPQLRRIDPAGSAVVEDALRRGGNLVALRPQPDPTPTGLRWAELKPTLLEPAVLMTRATRTESG